MRTTSRRLARLTFYGGSAVALAVLAFACSLQSDTNIAAPKPNARTSEAGKQGYVEFQITKPAQPLPGNPAARYPDVLRASNVDGSVLVQFVVRPDSVADMSTFKVLRTSDDLFTAAVRNTLARWRFSPAEVNGRQVSQLVQMPFQFSTSASGTSAAPLEPVVVTRLQDPGARSPRDTQTVRRLQTVYATARPTPVSANANLFEFQVERQARPLPGNRAPRYPDALRAANVEGEVLAQFVVDANGVVDMPTLKVLRSTDPAFTAAVREALPDFRFAPAEVGGRPVRQLMQMPFQFNLTRP